MAPRESSTIPTSKKWLVDGFCRFTHRMVAKQFISFAVQNEWMLTLPIDAKTPIVVYANHCGWWDPIVAMLLRKTYFPERTLYAPIDAEALQNYRIMSQLGFYGLQLNSLAGASAFLTTTKAILQTPNASVWITPEGEFCDARDHTKSLMPGLAHLATKVPGVYFIPLAIEYAFWDESRPQIFTRLGTPLITDDLTSAARNKSEWNELLTARLRLAQNELAASVIARDPSQFKYLIASRPARLGWYDYFRSWSAWMQGKKFDPRHRP
jgi:1-acyl-sn-glycerol-3-phosphate acyltransferase